MRLEIDPALADDPDAHRWLDRLMHKVEDGWHVWVVSGLEGFEATPWLPEAGTRAPWLRELCRRSAAGPGAWSRGPHGRQVRVTRARTGPTDMTPEEAVSLAEEPLTVLVENRFGDGAFLERVVHELDRPLRDWWSGVGQPARVDSVGGKGKMREEVRRRTDRTVRPRLVVVVDSDRRAPDEQASRDARRLARTCEELRVPCWVLAKREAENYLPRVLLEQRPNAGSEHRQQVDAWDGLDEDQKDHYDMKDGLAEEPEPAEEALFGGLSAHERATLAAGFGSKVGECWGQWKGQAAGELRARGRGDLERGLQLIRQEV